MTDTVVFDQLPVIPLSSVVFFPGIVVPLAVSEPNRLRLVDDAMAGDRLVVIATVPPGEDHAEPEPVCPVAGLGRIIHCEKHGPEQLNVLIHGMDRVRLTDELPTENKTYRRFRAELIPNPTSAEIDAAKTELLHLESCVISLVSQVAQSDAQLVEVVHSTTDPVRLADILSATVVSDVQQQQELLATVDLRARLQKLVDAMAEVMAHAQGAVSDNVAN